MNPTALPSLPASYRLEGDSQSGWIAVLRAAEEALSKVGFDLRNDGSARVVEERGRGSLLELELADVDGAPCRALVRHHRRGGLPARLGLVTFTDPARPFEELLLADELRARGVNTPRVFAARARRPSDDRGKLRRGFDLSLVTERVPGATDLFEALQSARGTRRHALVRGAGEFVAQLFDAGLAHSDLHPKNLLVVESAVAPGFAVVDLDKCTLEAPGQLSVAQRRNQLARLLRYCVRRRAAIEFSRTDALRFLIAHLRGGDWREQFQTIARRTAHRIAWSRRGH